MPISPQRHRLYPPDWPLISDVVRGERAGWRCERCRRRHRDLIAQVADGRWYDRYLGLWRDDHGRIAPIPARDDRDAAALKRVVITAAHLDHDPQNNDPRNLAALCGRCHLHHDAGYHRVRRHQGRRRNRAIRDLFDVA